MLSISKPDHCAERVSLELLSAYQEYLMTFKLMTSQAVQRAQPLFTHICVVGIQRVKEMGFYHRDMKFYVTILYIEIHTKTTRLLHKSD